MCDSTKHKYSTYFHSAIAHLVDFVAISVKGLSKNSIAAGGIRLVGPNENIVPDTNPQEILLFDGLNSHGLVGND